MAGGGSAPGHAEPADDLNGHARIGFDHSMAHVAPKPWLRVGRRGVTNVFRSNSPHARLITARAGLGFAMLPEPLMEGTPGLELVLPSREVDHLEPMVFVNADLLREPRATAVRDFLAEILQARGAAS